MPNKVHIKPKTLVLTYSEHEIKILQCKLPLKRLLWKLSVSIKPNPRNLQCGTINWKCHSTRPHRCITTRLANNGYQTAKQPQLFFMHQALSPSQTAWNWHDQYAQQSNHRRGLQLQTHDLNQPFKQRQLTNTIQLHPGQRHKHPLHSRTHTFLPMVLLQHSET